MLKYGCCVVQVVSIPSICSVVAIIMSSSDTFDPTVYEADLRPEADENAAVTTEGLKVATIRTSDRLLFKRCRRRWGWNSHLRGNLAPKTNAAPLWTGSGFHFALEDCHSQNLYGHPGLAFLAYREATLRQVNRDRRRRVASLVTLKSRQR